ncbi:MAG: 6-phosphofructokinase, partial [Coriobacteriia bacterium]
MTKRVGLLTAGSDSPGVNAAIRGFGRSAVNTYQMELIGFKDGFAGLIEDHTMDMNASVFSGILTVGGTILGTSLNVPSAMPNGSEVVDQTEQALKVYEKHKLDALVCICDRATQE